MTVLSFVNRPAEAHGRRKFSGAVWAALFLACLQQGCASSPTDAGDAELFEEISFATGAGKDQTIIEGHFLGDATAQLVVLSTDERAGRRLRMYSLVDRSWVLALDAAMASEVLFADVADIAGSDRLLIIERGQISWFDPETITYRPLVKIYSNYNSSQNYDGSATRAGGDIARVDITRDLNLDGRDDLIVPDFDGFWVAIQLADGSFSKPARYGPREPFLDAPAMNESKSYRALGISPGTMPVYMSRVHGFDQNQDGLEDLVFWNEDHFDVYHQNTDGLFETQAVSFNIDVPIDSDGIYSRAYDFVNEGVISLLFGFNESSKRTVLHSFRDLNADGVADLVTLTLSGRSMLRQRSVYAVYSGKSTANGLAFASNASATLAPKGRAGGMQPWGYSSQLFQDFNSDGQLDVMFRDVRVGFGGMARAMIGNSVSLDLEFYRQEDGVFPDSLITRRKVSRFSPLAGLGNVFFPPVLLGDVDGDGYSDLLVGQSPNELLIWPGVSGADTFADKPRKISVALPSDERKTWLSDLNRDGKQDIIIVHGPTDHAPDTESSVTTLVSR